MKKQKRKSRAMDPDVKQLSAANLALERTTPRMRRHTLIFLWDKYVTFAALLGPAIAKAEGR